MSDPTGAREASRRRRPQRHVLLQGLTGMALVAGVALLVSLLGLALALVVSWIY